MTTANHHTDIGQKKPTFYASWSWFFTNWPKCYNPHESLSFPSAVAVSRGQRRILLYFFSSPPNIQNSFHCQQGITHLASLISFWFIREKILSQVKLSKYAITRIIKILKGFYPLSPRITNHNSHPAISRWFTSSPSRQTSKSWAHLAISTRPQNLLLQSKSTNTCSSFLKQCLTAGDE